MKTAEQDILLVLCLAIVAVMLFGCESPQPVRRTTMSPVDSEPAPEASPALTWVTLRWQASNAPVRVEWTEDFSKPWVTATNTTASTVTGYSAYPQLFFKVTAL